MPQADRLVLLRLLMLDGNQDPDSLKRAVRSKPPILLVHGDRENVIPVEALSLSADALAGANVPCEWHLSLGVGHGIDGGGLRAWRLVPRPHVRAAVSQNPQPRTVLSMILSERVAEGHTPARQENVTFSAAL